MRWWEFIAPNGDHAGYGWGTSRQAETYVVSAGLGTCHACPKDMSDHPLSFDLAAELEAQRADEP